MERFSNSYLENHIEEPVSKQSKKEILSRVDKDIYPHEWSDSGVFEFEKGATKFSLKYFSPEFSELFKLGVQEGSITPNAIKVFLGRYRQIEELIISNQDTNLDISEILPEGYRVFFNPHSNNMSGSKLDVKNKMIFITSDILLTSGLLALFHELGHQETINDISSQNPAYLSDRAFAYQDLKYNESLRRDYLRKPENAETSAELLLRDERNAWANALNNIRPFVKDLEINVEDAKDLIHEYCLESYSQFIEKNAK